METFTQAVLLAIVAGVFSLGGALLGYKGLVQKEHRSLSDEHKALSTDHTQLRERLSAVSQNIIRIEKDEQNTFDKIIDVAEKVTVINGMLLYQEKLQKIAHENLDINQEKMLESVEYIKTLGAELERLSTENAELRQENQKLKAQIQQMGKTNVRARDNQEFEL